jgi:hypothetical protein
VYCTEENLAALIKKIQMIQKKSGNPDPNCAFPFQLATSLSPSMPRKKALTLAQGMIRKNVIALETSFSGNFFFDIFFDQFNEIIVSLSESLI